MMGQYSMIQIVKKISDYLSPTVIGIRMPVLFNNEEFFKLLEDDGVFVHASEVRKAGPQLFIIFSV